MSHYAHDSLAMDLLTRLSIMADKEAAGVRSRKPTLTARDLDKYRQTRSMTVRDGFEAVASRVEQTGAIVLKWDDEPLRSGLIKRIELLDANLLAKALGKTPYAQTLAQATAKLRQVTTGTLLQDSPLWGQIIGAWERCKRVRGIGAGEAELLCQAIVAVLAARASIEQGFAQISLRAASRHLFQDSKHLEKLSSLADLILLEDIEAEARTPDEVWQELGLLKESQPIRLAGRIAIDRGRLDGLIDAPYGAYDPESVLATEGELAAVLTVENQTNFHAMAREMAELPVLLVYTAGMPSPAWCRAYQRLLASAPAKVPILHWGDIDEGGFRIAARLATEALTVGRTLEPFLMHPGQIPSVVTVDKAAPHTVRLMSYHAQKAGWGDMVAALEDAALTLEQEAFLLQAHGGEKALIAQLLTRIAAVH